MLENIFSAKQIRRDAESLGIWGKDWTNGFNVDPAAVVFPESNEQVQELVKCAIAEEWKLVPSGGRTGLSGGAVAGDREVVVSFDRMQQILEFNADDRLVRCQAGVVTQQLQEFAEQQGMFFLSACNDNPFDISVNLPFEFKWNFFKTGFLSILVISEVASSVLVI